MPPLRADLSWLATLMQRTLRPMLKCWKTYFSEYSMPFWALFLLVVTEAWVWVQLQSWAAAALGRTSVILMSGHKTVDHPSIYTEIR